MDDDFLPDPDRWHRSVENSGESNDEGGYRFLFYDAPMPRKKRGKDKKEVKIGAPVHLELSTSELTNDIVRVHNNEAVKKKVEELGEIAKDIESEEDSQ